MSISNIPFYIYWETYVEFITINFSFLNLTDDALFIGFIILNIALLFLIIFLVKIVKFFVLLGKNLILR